MTADKSLVGRLLVLRHAMPWGSQDALLLCEASDRIEEDERAEKLRIEQLEEADRYAAENEARIEALEEALRAVLDAWGDDGGHWKPYRDLLDGSPDTASEGEK